MKTKLNPYAPSNSENPSVADGKPLTRSSLAQLIESFLHSEITAFEFDEQLDAFHASHDPIIRHVVEAVWFHYDDCDDHLVCLTKQQWDHFQRLLLVLCSKCQIETQFRYQWSMKQLVAAATLCAFVCFAAHLGWGEHLLTYSIPFGIVSTALSLCRDRERNTSNPYTALIFPFATFADLARAYHSSGFSKTRYPKHIGSRRIRSPSMDVYYRLHMHLMWLIFSPIPLFFQSLPEKQTEVRVTA